MSRMFAWFMLVLAVVMLGLAGMNLDSAAPAAIVLWVVVGAASIYTLFFKKPSSG